MSYGDWKKKFQTPATPEMLAAFKANKHLFAKHDEEGAAACGCGSKANASTVAADFSGRAVPLPLLPPPGSVANPSALHSDVCSSNQGFATSASVAIINVAILTVSDRASTGVYQDLSGPRIKECLELYSAGNPGAWVLRVVHSQVVPDERAAIIDFLELWSEPGSDCNVCLTTGGTGFAPRDVTPEATTSILDKQAPGLMAAIQTECVKLEPMALLSRAVAGTRNRTLVVNLPGRPKAVTESLAVLMPLLGAIVTEVTKT
jgi:molybdenum cofactor synthesis domain-containing protein